MRWVTYFMCIVVASCGGAVSSIATNGGVGSGGTGISWGTVVGFGSVLVDGTTYNSQTPTYYAGDSNKPDASSNASAVLLGSQVLINLDASGAPSSLKVMPSLVGLVSSVNSNTSTFTVNGVTVKVNTNGSNGPITNYVGMSGFSGVSRSMNVEVHGALGIDSSNAVYVQATLIKLLTTSNTVTQVSGVISNLTSSGFNLGTQYVSLAAGTGISPANSNLANGQWVNVWTNQPISNGLTANNIQILTIQGTIGSVQMSGVVSQLNSNSKTFLLNGTTIDASSTTLASTFQSLSNGTYVTVNGLASTTSNQLTANSLVLASTQAALTTLQGTITNYVSNSNFMVRNVNVDASTVCGGSNCSSLGNSVFVKITGTVNPSTPNQITATTISIQAASDGETVNYQGTVQSVSNNSFVMSVLGSNQTMTVSYASNVAFASSNKNQIISGAVVEVEGALTSVGNINAYCITVNFTSNSSSNGSSTSFKYAKGVAYNVSLNSSGLGYFYINGVQYFVQSPVTNASSVVNGSDVDIQYSISNNQNVVQEIDVETN